MCCIVPTVLLYSCRLCDMVGAVDRGLMLIRARSRGQPRLAEREPSPTRMEGRARRGRAQASGRMRTAGAQETPPTRVVMKDAEAQTSGPATRLRPPHYSKAVETDRVTTHSVGSQTDASLLLQPGFLLGLLAGLQSGTENARGPSTSPSGSLRGAALDLQPLQRSLRRLEELESSSSDEEWWGETTSLPAPATSAATRVLSEPKPDNPLIRRRKVLLQTPPFTRQPPANWGSWRND